MPNSVSIADLMCWCWSDSPQHRPNFTQILTTLRKEAFTNLLATAEMLESDRSRRQITASCMGMVMDRHIKSSILKDMHPSMCQMMSRVQSMKSLKGENAMQVFYGTDSGQCGMIQFQSTGTIKKVMYVYMFIQCPNFPNGKGIVYRDCVTLKVI